MLTSNDIEPLKESGHMPVNKVPADFSDPNHPHNGDVESQPNYRMTKSCFSKRAIWTILLSTLFLGTLAAAMGIGWWYGKTHLNNAAATVSLDASTKTHFITTGRPVATATITASPSMLTLTTLVLTTPTPIPDTTVPFNKPEPVTDQREPQSSGSPTETPPQPPSLPTEDSPKEGDKLEPECLISGHFARKSDCEDHCPPMEGRRRVGCDVRAGVWKCYRCVQ